MDTMNFSILMKSLFYNNLDNSETSHDLFGSSKVLKGGNWLK